MVQSLCGATHQVFSSYCVSKNDGETQESVVQRLVCTDVVFREASEQEIVDYVATGEGRDKAGSYAVQGIGAFLVQEIRGSYSSVVGLPFCELVVDLRELGLLERYPPSGVKA